MREFLTAHLVHVIAVATLISRLGDIGTTYLVTPTLKVEANPLVRKMGWRYALATTSLALIPYYSIHGGVVVLTVSFIVCALNGSEALLARSLGEEKYAELHHDAMLNMPFFLGVSLQCLPGFFCALLALVLSLLFPQSIDNWGYDIVLGIMLSAIALFIFYPMRFLSERGAVQVR